MAAKGPSAARIAVGVGLAWLAYRSWRDFDPLPGFTFSPSTPATPPPTMQDPSAWLEDLDAELAAAGVTNFTARELTQLRKVKDPYPRPYYDEPPAELWPNLVEAARLAQRVRDIYGGPLRAYNGWRPQWYNDAVGGAPDSWHTRAGAIDLTPASPVTADKVERLHAAAAQAIDELGPDTGGLGIYSTAAHVDIGPKRSWNA